MQSPQTAWEAPSNFGYVKAARLFSYRPSPPPPSFPRLLPNRSQLSLIISDKLPLLRLFLKWLLLSEFFLTSRFKLNPSVQGPSFFPALFFLINIATGCTTCFSHWLYWLFPWIGSELREGGDFGLLCSLLLTSVYTIGTVMTICWMSESYLSFSRKKAPKNHGPGLRCHQQPPLYYSS